MRVASSDQGYGACIPALVPRLLRPSNDTQTCRSMLVHFQRDPIETLVSGLLYHSRESGEPWTGCPIVPCGRPGEPSCCESCRCSGCDAATAGAASCARDETGACVERLAEIGRFARAAEMASSTGQAASILGAHGLTLPRMPGLARALREAPSYQALLAAGIAAWHEADRPAGPRGGEMGEGSDGGAKRDGRSPPRLAGETVFTPPALRLAMQAELVRYAVVELPHALALHQAALRSSGCAVRVCLNWFMNGSRAYRDATGLVLRRLGLNASAADRVQRDMGAHDIAAHPTPHSTSRQGAETAHARLAAQLRALATALDREVLGGWLARHAVQRDAYAGADACGLPPPRQRRTPPTAERAGRREGKVDRLTAVSV
jgi:hypothetical protein